MTSNVISWAPLVSMFVLLEAAFTFGSHGHTVEPLLAATF